MIESMGSYSLWWEVIKKGMDTRALMPFLIGNLPIRHTDENRCPEKTLLDSVLQRNDDYD